MQKKIIFALAMGLLASNAFSFVKARELPGNLDFGDCANYHVKHAYWKTSKVFKGKKHKLELEGRCTKGMKHGNFLLYFDGELISKAKVSRDETQYAKCYDGENKQFATSNTLNGCIEAYVKKILR